MEDPPHVRAEKEIDNLIASGLFETGDVKAFYFIFSETIRRYMESIRRFPGSRNDNRRDRKMGQNRSR